VNANPIAPLAPDALYVFVFGPGYGESVVLRIPPAHWVVIDGCRSSSFSSYPAKLLKDFGAHADILVLTHPHLDHAAGLDGLLDDWKGHKVGCCEPIVENVDEMHPNAQKAVEGLTVKKVLSRIQSVWRKREDTRWPLCRGTLQAVGDARLEVLHPDEEALRTSSVNGLSSPILIEWHRVRLLLGSDLELPGWEDVAASRSDLARHHLLKLPHHASDNGRHEAVARRDAAWSPPRFWIATPMNRKWKLPQFDDGQGLAQWLEHEPEVHLTGLPEPYRSMSLPPWITDRRRVLLEGRPPPQDSIPGLPGIIPDRPPRETLDHFIMAAFSRDGQRIDVRHGDGAVVIKA